MFTIARMKTSTRRISTAVCALNLWMCLAAIAQEVPRETVQLPDVTVVGTSDNDWPIDVYQEGASFADIVEWLPGVSLRQQGNGAVNDLRLRGSSFSGAGYTIAGSTLRNPQTEHFQAKLPLPAELFGPLTLALGMEQLAWGTGHSVGSVVTDFAPIASGGTFGVSLGERGSHEQRLFWQEQFPGAETDGRWGIGLFGTRETSAGFDYDANDLRSGQGGAHLQYASDQTQFDLAAGYQHKDFGAVGFYGVSDAMQSREELRDTLILTSLRHNLSEDGDFVRGAASWRRLHDVYTLNDLNPTYYRNSHVTRIATGALDGRLSLNRRLALNWRLAIEDERIDSEGIFLSTPNDGLGKHERQRYSAMLLPEWSQGPWQIQAGGRIVDFSDEKPEGLLLFDIARDLSEKHTASLSYTESVRQPSFTELDYESPTSLGNNGLENELGSDWAFNITSRWSPVLRTKCELFLRETENTVDWIRLASGGRWLATDMGDVTTKGMRATINWKPGKATELEAAYQHLHKSTITRYQASRYVFDYPEHELDLRIRHSLPAGWEVILAQTLLRQKSNPARDGDRTGVLSRISLAYTPPKFLQLTASVAVENVWNDTFQSFPGQRPVQRNISGYLTWSF